MTSAQGEDRSDFEQVLPPVDRNGKLLDFIWFKATEATNWKSKTYARNIALAKQHRVPFGSYHFLHPSLDVDLQVASFLAFVSENGGLEPGAMLACDSEISSGVNGRPMLRSDRSDLLLRDPITSEARIRPGVDYPHRLLSHSTPAQLAADLVDSATREFMQRLQLGVGLALGGDECQECVYTFLDMAHQLPSCTEYPLWIAFFSGSAPGSVTPWKDWTQWQYAGGGGNGGSDQDAFNGTTEQFNSWRLAKVRKQPPPPPQPSGNVTLSVTVPELALGAVDRPGNVEFVHRLQWALSGLASVGIPQAVGLKADGVFGPKTQLAVTGMQVFAKLARDISSASGKVGENEWKFLFAGIRGNA